MHPKRTSGPRRHSLLSRPRRASKTQPLWFFITTSASKDREFKMEISVTAIYKVYLGICQWKNFKNRSSFAEVNNCDPKSKRCFLKHGVDVYRVSKKSSSICARSTAPAPLQEPACHGITQSYLPLGRGNDSRPYPGRNRLILDLSTN